jgi:hypothetical protein
MKTRSARDLTAVQLWARLERLRGVRAPAVPRQARSRVAAGAGRRRLSRLDAGRRPFLRTFIEPGGDNARALIAAIDELLEEMRARAQAGAGTN